MSAEDGVSLGGVLSSWRDSLYTKFKECKVVDFLSHRSRRDLQHYSVWIPAKLSVGGFGA